jgi:DNA gyrase subunit A
VFVLNTHTPVLFFSSRGMVYKMKAYRLPLGTPQARGKALVNLLPLREGETITTMMPLPEDEDSWDQLSVMFATASGSVRRNRLSDFTSVMANGKIAMKLEAGDQLIGVQPCEDDDNVLLAAAGGKCIRFPVTDVRVFSGRNSIGVRGIRLLKKDTVISMSILRHVEFDMEERAAYLKRSRAERAEAPPEGEDNGAAVELDEARYAALAAQDEFIFTIAANGYGKRTSAYEYTVRNRGGQGIVNIELGGARNNAVVASFPVTDGTQLVLVTDAGQLTRTTVDDIRIVGRATRGVIVFRVAKDERVVSVTCMDDDAAAGNGANGNGANGGNADAGNGSGNDNGNGANGSGAEGPNGSGADEPDGSGADD